MREKWNFVFFLYCCKYWTDEDSLIFWTTFPQIYGKWISRLTFCWYLNTITLHHCAENQKNYQNNFRVLGPNLPQDRLRNIVFFILSLSGKRLEKSLNYSVIFDDEWGDEETMKRAEFTRPFSLWWSKIKKSLELYFVSQTRKRTNRTEFIGPFSL